MFGNGVVINILPTPLQGMNRRQTLYTKMITYVEGEAGEVVSGDVAFPPGNTGKQTMLVNILVFVLFSILRCFFVCYFSSNQSSRRRLAF